MPRLKIGLISILIIGVLAFSGDDPRLGAGVLAALLIHEISHILTSRLLGYQVSELKLSIFGGSLTIDPIFETDPAAETIIAAAGPAVNFMMALGVIYLRFLGVSHDCLDYWQQLNWFTGLVNLIPAYPLDGGRIIHAWLVKFCGLKTASRVARIVTLSIGIFFLISGGIQFLIKTGGFILCGVGLFILGQHKWFNQVPGMTFLWRIHRHKQQLLRRQGFINARPVVVEPRTPLHLPLQYYGAGEYLMFFMNDGPGKLRLISEDQAWNILCKEGYRATFDRKPPSGTG